MVTFTSAQPCEGLLPDCSVGVKGTGGKTTQAEQICSMHSNILPDKSLNESDKEDCELQMLKLCTVA